MKTVVLVVWALAATAAAVFLALPPAPIVGPSAPGTRPGASERRLPPDRSGASIEALLAMSVPKPPEPTAEPGKTPSEQVADLLAILDSFREVESSKRWADPEYKAARRKLFGLVAWHPKSHLALMEQLRTAQSEDEIDELLAFLVWNPWVGSNGDGRVAESIDRIAREMLARDPDVARRSAAARVLCRYGNFDREDFDFGLARLEAEPSAGVRSAMLEELVVAGRAISLTQEEAEPFLAHVRRSLDDGDAWLGSSIADWSEDPEDFRRLRERLASEKDPYERQGLVNAFSGEHVLVRGRVDEARAVLIGLLTDPTEDAGVRTLARDFLARSFGPMDEASADAVSRYDAEQKGR